MRCFFICMMLSMASLGLAAQKEKKNEDDGERVFTKVEIESGPDLKSWTAYLKKATKLTATEAASIPAGAYKVNVAFIIDTYGNIIDVKAKNNPGYGLAKKAEKIVSGYEGKCIPASQCGRNVKSYKTEAIEFVVEN